MDLHLVLDPALGLRDGLERALREAIGSGRLAPGGPLPSTRELAAELGMARGTVSRAYEHLTAEGLLVARRGSGTRVADARPAPPARVRSAPWTTLPPFPGFDLRPGMPDLSAFPRAAWLASTRRVLREVPSAALGYGDRAGHHLLREALAAYLGRARGVIASADHIVVCAGYTQALRLLGRVLRRHGATAVAFEDPAPPDFPDLVESAGLATVRVPVDGEGLVVGALPEDVGAVVVTPAHQYPLGVTLAPRRRAALLATGVLVVEDDYDGEFGAAAGSLQGLAPGRVVYTGTASKSLAPALRLAWMAVPDALLGPLREVMRYDESPVNALDQLVLADLITSGALDRHLAASRRRYRRRHDRLVEALGPLPAGGLHAVVRLAEGEQEVLARLHAAGVACDALSGYYADPENAPGGLVIGYATPPEHAFGPALTALTGVLARR
ncbi:PLP-dependent aminotransferase family protein [Actinocorallia longicatena]|uniref:PLP-dependent aminotransferase family protein n=1 Tax=Actinocorallia longicatena TaxID=111803 RepID=A0ABP6Q499_9ACTN